MENYIMVNITLIFNTLVPTVALQRRNFDYASYTFNLSILCNQILL